MRPSLQVHVNRTEPRSVESEADSFVVDGPFDIVLENHGQPTHVHVAVDDALADVTDLAETNYYVTGDEPTTIPVDVHSIDAVEGHLEVATGYGAQKSIIGVFVEAGSGGVEVDEDLGKIQLDTEAEPASPSDYVVPGAFVAVGVLVAVLVAILVDDVMAVVAGVLTVVLAVGVALALVLWD